MKIYRVGGSVRDELLGRPRADRDYVVVGATAGELLARGFRPVGRDFPVFLHPETHEEYALARTERKTGRGHQGFSFHAAPGVTLDEDLARRDLTINAMALADDGTLIDPFGGAEDLRAGILRHVGPAFAEDPLRVLRAMQLAARFDFHLAPETAALSRRIAGTFTELPVERVWAEWEKWAVKSAVPSRGLAVLEETGWLRHFPEIALRLQRAREDCRTNHLDIIQKAAQAGGVIHKIMTGAEEQARLSFGITNSCIAPVAVSTRPSLFVPKSAIQIEPSGAGRIPYGSALGVGQLNVRTFPVVGSSRPRKPRL